MSEKRFPLTRPQLDELAKRYPTPFYIYGEKAIRENVRAVKKAFSVFPSYKEHYAVKALPNPFILKILADEGLGADCASLPELILADMAGMKGEDLMLTSNETPAREYSAARDLGAVINLDDFSHIEYLEKTAGIPELISCRYNPGPLKGGNAIIGKPEEAKYGFTREQILAAFPLLRDKGAKRFALHTMVASNELNVDYHIETGRILFELAAELKAKTGIRLEFVNLGGGAGIPYKPEQEAIDYGYLAGGLKKAYDEIIVPAGLDPLGIHTEWARAITGPYGWLVTRAIHKKEIYRNYIGLDSCMADLMRPALYGAYHHITIPGKETAPLTETYDVVGSLCENNDKFAVQRQLPKIEIGDFVVIHDAGAHGRAMGFNYNGKLRCGELLLQPDGSVLQIRRRETIEDLFATLDRVALEDFKQHLAH
ncbi:diaminopimelate decarboxylase [Treponema primitia]|uniref:diaminopimelate decarboxylase n=1 Tax=Treponema primitia TaxID=88058 RepID=UPI000255553C|nr:diaminopimelate decarboxylase [Treponema primitia]